MHFQIKIKKMNKLAMKRKNPVIIHLLFNKILKIIMIKKMKMKIKRVIQANNNSNNNNYKFKRIQ